MIDAVGIEIQSIMVDISYVMELHDLVIQSVSDIPKNHFDIIEKNASEKSGIETYFENIKRFEKRKLFNSE